MQLLKNPINSCLYISYYFIFSFLQSSFIRTFILSKFMYDLISQNTNASYHHLYSSLHEQHASQHV